VIRGTVAAGAAVYPFVVETGLRQGMARPAGAAMDDDAGHEPGAAHVPITPELLADLQAGLLDDATAVELRQRVRTDTDAAEMLAALDRVRR